VPRFVAPRIAAALRTLVGEQREILLLHAWAELSHEEIAVALDIPPGTVRSRLSRACAALREELHGFDFDLWEFEAPTFRLFQKGTNMTDEIELLDASAVSSRGRRPTLGARTGGNRGCSS